jgi:hypothetical protein
MFNVAPTKVATIMTAGAGMHAGIDAALHDKTAGMTTRASISWPLLVVAAGALTLAACKKSSDTTAPDSGSDVSQPEDNGGDAAPEEDSAPEFLTVDVFEDVVNQKTSDVTDCFAAAKEKKPDLGGKLMLEFTIDGTGKVSEVKTESGSTVNDPGLTTCVTDKARTWAFPKTRDGQPMTLPYSFNLT